ncbi:MAG: NAD-dependent epimerase/dehydratase family protein, partial [Planctomycetes bacterium]|nr:NAD-dependent epimerase/dehydratase family protein [Planctomycetota bacterium]
MHALVTGAGGFLGRYVVEQLLARGDRVRGFCRGAYPHLESLGVEMIRGDVCDAAAVAEACRGVDVVFHVAAVAGIWGPWQHYYSINTLGTRS